MNDDGTLKMTRRTFARRTAVLLGSLIVTACGANRTTVSTPIVTRPAATPTIVPTPTPFAIPSPATGQPGQTIYVNTHDPNADDANPGTMDRPLKTVGKAADIALDNNTRNIGTSVVISPGIYRESVSLQPKTWPSHAPIQFQAKENGTAIIAGSDVRTGWRKQGTTNVYTQAWPYKWGLAPIPSGWEGHVDLKPIVRRREMVFINGTALTQVLSSRELKEGTFFVNEQVATISLMPPSGVAVESATIEVAVRSGLFTAEGAQNLTIRGLVFTHDNTPVDGTAVTLINCSNVVVEDCKFLWNNWAGMTFLTSPPQSSHAMIARRNVANNNGAVGMAASFVRDLLYEDNETSYNNWRGILGGFDGWSAAGMKHFGIHGGTYRRHRAVGNQAAACWFDTDCANIEFDQAFCSHNRGPAFFIEASQGPTAVRDCIISQSQNDAGILTEGGANVLLERNTVYGNAGSQIRVLKGVRPIKNAETNENLTLAAGGWTLRKNVIVGTDANPRLMEIGNSVGANDARFLGTIAADENVWYSPKSGAAFNIDHKDMDFNTWQSASRQDATSQFVDPQFVNPESDDFRLRDTSPIRGSSQQPAVSSQQPADGRR